MLLIAQCFPFLPTAAWASSANLRPVVKSSVDPFAQKWTRLLADHVVVHANSQAQSYTCPLTGEQLRCEKCCPLNEAKQQAQEQTFTCPVTGEQLPCEKCCPLNGAKAEAKVEAKTDTKKEDQTYICPITGEELACPKCCPLNDGK